MVPRGEGAKFIYFYYIYTYISIFSYFPRTKKNQNISKNIHRNLHHTLRTSQSSWFEALEVHNQFFLQRKIKKNIFYQYYNTVIYIHYSVLYMYDCMSPSPKVIELGVRSSPVTSFKNIKYQKKSTDFVGLSAEFASMLLVVLVGGFTLIGGLGDELFFFQSFFFFFFHIFLLHITNDCSGKLCFCSYVIPKPGVHMTGYARSRDYVENL